MKKSLVLTGMMGVGKSTVGKSLSIKLNMKFVDVDRIIENEEKMFIKEIFKRKGEQYFRKIEKKKSLETLKESNLIIALGGGAFINDEIRTLTLKNCISFWLDASIKQLLNRNAGSKKRPLLNNKNHEETLIKILDERKKFYEYANYKVDCNNIKQIEIVENILKTYENN